MLVGAPRRVLLSAARHVAQRSHTQIRQISNDTISSRNTTDAKSALWKLSYSAMKKRKQTGGVVVQKRGARWAKIIGKMSQAQIDQMKQNAQVSGTQKKQPRQFLLSTGQVADQWLPVSWGSPTTTEFYQAGWQYLRHQFANYMATPWRLRTLSKELKQPRITRAQVRDAARTIFERYNEALANLEIDRMEQFVAEPWHYELRHKYAQRRANPALDYKWECKDVNIEILTYNAIKVPPPISSEFVQAAVRITSHQKLRIVKKGTEELVAGKDEWMGPVTDTYVIEKAMDANSPNTPWVIITTNFKVKDNQ